MNSAKQSQGTLWRVVAVGVLALIGCPASHADAAPTHDLDREALVWFRLSLPPIESQTQLLSARVSFPASGPALDQPTAQFVTIDTLLAIRNRALEHRLALSRAGARSSIAAAELGSTDASGRWAALALRVLHGLQDEPTDPDLAAAEFEGQSWYAPAIRSAPRRMKDLFVGPTNRRWDDPDKDFLPDPFAERQPQYPTPGAAAVALIAGVCSLGRRRR